jgi:hypothetical protein
LRAPSSSSVVWPCLARGAWWSLVELNIPSRSLHTFVQSFDRRSFTLPRPLGLHTRMWQKKRFSC